MGKGDHGDNCFAATNVILYPENETVLPSLDSMSPTIRNRHCSESNGPIQPIFIFGSMPSLGKSKDKGHIAGGIVRKVPLIYSVEQQEILLEKDGESGEEEKEHVKGQGAARRNLVLAILLLANLINYMDRYTIAGVLEDVKNFYDINNGEAGLLQTSFIISYMVLSPVFGYLGDRYNRKYIMASGILFWSIVTLAGSFVPSDKYWAFLFLRALVGVGEASYSTIAPSIIADIVPTKMRTKALSIFFFAIPVGSGLGYIVGSKVAMAFGSWQWALRVTPFLGVICTILVCVVVVEPRRGHVEDASHSQIQRTPFLSDVLYLLKHKSFMLLSFGFTCVAFVAGALALWAPLYMHRSMQVQQVNMEADTVSLIFGVITCAAGFSGVALGSFTASKLRKVSKRADPLVCAFGLITSAPFMYFALSMSTYNSIVPWVLIFIGETLLSLNWALVTDILLYVVIPTRRSTAEACQILLAHALGDAGSPYLVGVVSDAIASSFGYKDVLVEYISLQYALFIPCFMCVLGGGFFLATALFLDSDRRETEKAIKDASSKCSNDSSSNSLTTSSGQTISQTTETNISDTDQQISTNSSETSSQEMSSEVATLVNTSAPKSDTKKSSSNLSKISPEICVPHNGTVTPQPTGLETQL